MTMTQPQYAALKAAINANPTWAAYPPTGDGFYDLAKALSAEASPVFWVWSTAADVGVIRAAVTWANLTPNDPPDTTQGWANRSLQCQGKQFNLQMILPFTGTINGADVNLRTGLQDALQGVRSGSGGTTQDAGWTAVRNALARRAKFIEQILADTTAGNGSSRAQSATMVYEGDVSDADVRIARTT